MDGITKLIIEGDQKAISLAKTCVTTPTIINTDSRQGPIYAIALDCETNQMSASAEVSESLVISSDSKKYMSDNVAPGGKNWHLSGYITAAGVISKMAGIGNALYPTNKFQPMVKFNTDVLWNWFNHGAVLVYKDGNARIYKKVVIKELQTSQIKDAGNATAFTLTLKEINTMDTSLDGIEDNVTMALDKAAKSLPAEGSSIGFPLKMGSSMASLVG